MSLGGERTGECAYIDYGEEPELWHEALVVGSAGPERPYHQCIPTPDDDVYVENLSPDNIVSVKWRRDYRLPTGLGSRQGHPVYRFAGKVGPRKIKEIKQEVLDAIAEFRRSEGLPEKVAVQAGATVVPARSALPKANESQAYIVVVSDIHDFLAGTEIQPDFDGSDLQIGNVAIMTRAGDVAVAELVELSQADALIKRRAEALKAATPRGLEGLGQEDDEDDDIRTLPVKYESTGERYRCFDEVVNRSSEDVFDEGDWPVEGPRTALWWLKSTRRLGCTPGSRHTKWTSESGVLSSGRSIYELETISEALEKFACIDQLNLPNLAGIEILVRRLQLIEDAHAIHPTQPTYEGSEHWMGNNRRRGAMLVDPRLSRHVAGRVKDETEVAKERRTAREERRLGPKKGKNESDDK